MQVVPIKRALLSVSNKTGLVEFAQGLAALGVEIISTGGTSQLLRQAAIHHRQVEDITHFPEMLDGRVKTLHPHIQGGILGKRDSHAAEMAAHKINPIDLVVVNFYPFAEIFEKSDVPWHEAVEYIDIGGPTMARAAAKNFSWVSVVTDPADYQRIMMALQHQAGLDMSLRRDLAAKVFETTAQYDAMIHQFFQQSSAEQAYPDYLQIKLKKLTELRYGENPHQRACAYQFMPEKPGVLSAIQHQGKPLSFNNILDAEATWSCVQTFSMPTAVIVKHTNPCGAATAETIDQAYLAAYAADPVSAFGGIIALNRPCSKLIADAISLIFVEVVLAPAYTADALAVLANKPNLRVLTMNQHLDSAPTWEMKCLTDGILLQEKDVQAIEHTALQVVTQLSPKQSEIESMLFAWRVLKHMKSNAILIAKNQTTLGIGVGQVSRIDAVDIAVQKAQGKMQGAVLASDAFFPFRDSIDRLAHSGICAIIQPGGSIRDDEVITACNEHHIAMVFTGKRCFKH